MELVERWTGTGGGGEGSNQGLLILVARATSRKHRTLLVSRWNAVCHTPRSWPIIIRRSQPRKVNDLIIRTADDIPLSNKFLILCCPRSAQNFYDLRFFHLACLSAINLHVTVTRFLASRFARLLLIITGVSAFSVPPRRVGLNTFSDGDHFAGFL